MSSVSRSMPGATTAGSRSGPRDWKDTLGRVGLVGKGVLFAVIGVLAIQLATGDAAQQTSYNGAIEWVADQPFGKFLLVALTVSLFALAAWRLLDALLGDPVEGSEASDRAKFAVKGVLYLGLAIASLSATIANWTGSEGSGPSGGTTGGGGGQQQATATVLEWPGGRWLVVAAGLAVIAYAAYVVKKHTVDQEFTERLERGRDSWVATLGRYGYLARSAVYVAVGWFLIQAGLTYDPNDAKGLSGTLQELSGEGWGRLLLWGIALGLLAYGAFNVAEAKYRRAA